VYRAGELVPEGDVEAAAKAVLEMNFEYGVFPSNVYDANEPTRQLIDRNIITPLPDAPALIVNDVRFTRVRVTP
jgi:hypothetical protein